MSRLISVPFKNREPTERELEDLLLLALAKREQMVSDEELKPVPPRGSLDFTGNVARIARFEGWHSSWHSVDAAMKRLAAAGTIVVGECSAQPDVVRRLARLTAKGYARALSVSRAYLGEPLLSFKRDVIFDETGIGQIEVNFLGERIVIGCVEGEEDRTVQFAHRFEVDSGEVMKAVAGLDHVRAMLMAGVLAEERVDDLEAQVRTNVPGSDRIVSLDHNSADYQTAVAALDNLIVTVGDNNVYRETDLNDQERRLAELEAGRKLLGARWLSLATLKAAVIGTVTYLAARFADVPIGEAATAAWKALRALLGL